MHLPSFDQCLFIGTAYVAVCAILVNFLPKDTIFDQYPRVKKAYGTAVLFLAVSAFNIRKHLPAANVRIPFLGFDDYQKAHPELFGQVEVEQKLTTKITGAVGENPAAAAAAVEAAKPKE